MLASNSSRLGSYAEIIKDGLPSGRHFYAENHNIIRDERGKNFSYL